MTPDEITYNLSCEQRPSDAVYFRVILTLAVNKYFAVCDRFCRDFWKGEIKFVRSVRPVANSRP